MNHKTGTSLWYVGSDDARIQSRLQVCLPALPQRTPALRPTHWLRLILFLTSHCFAAGSSTQACFADDATSKVEQLTFFETKVRPVLAEHCYSCHAADAESIKAGLSLDSRDGLMTGGDSGPSIVPGKPEESLFVEAIRYESYQMPPKGKLAEEQIRDLSTWIKWGAPWPEEPAPKAGVKRPTFDIAQRKQEHWVWEPIQNPAVPNVSDQDWPKSSIDSFILSSLEKEGLTPAKPVDRRGLIRRLNFDIIGLPPTPAEVDAFVKDYSNDAIEKEVDRLLASPQFGERWGRHWLDLVRYSESRGHEFDYDIADAYQYRDYVIRMFNADVPYDQVVREHIAGDLVHQPRINRERGFNESILGTGFWHLGEGVQSPVETRKDESDRFDNMIDVMSKTFLGVTVACARCHDHKFDAISTADYYALSGFLQGSDYRLVPFESLEQNKIIDLRLNHLDQDFRQRITKAVNETSHDLLENLEKLVAAHLASAEKPAAEKVIFDAMEPSSTLLPQDGFIFGRAPVAVGELMVGPKPGDDKPSLKVATHASLRNDPFWNGLKHEHGRGLIRGAKLESIPRSGRTVRTKTIELTDGKVDCRVRGAGWIVVCVDSHRIVDGPLHHETIAEVNSPGHSTWVRLNLGRYIGHRLHFEFTPKQDEVIEVQFVAQGLSEQEKQSYESLESTLRQEVTNVQTAIDHLLLQADPSVQELNDLVVTWNRERQALSQKFRKFSLLAPSMLDGDGEDDRILIRGSASNPGPIVPRRFLEVLDGSDPLQVPSGSGRLQLAERINALDNPLTHRVIVNRIWHHLMGRGIVASTDDFGVLGRRPTHPELLDHLATKFRDQGQSIKSMIRSIVLSKTYQMSSLAEAASVEKDPANLLWHHVPPKRLQAEAIRDAMLAVSGRLDLTPGGPSIPVHLTSFMEGRGRPPRNGPLDGAGRRSIYLESRRNFLSPFMSTFDAPTPFSSMGKRNVSNVPAQALILMNDPLVHELSTSWAKRAIAENPDPADIAARVTWLYETAFSRPPSDEEFAIAKQFIESLQDSNPELVWSHYAHLLMNTKEFIFLR